MTNEKPVLPEDPREAEPGRGAPGDDHVGVQTAQTTAAVFGKRQLKLHWLAPQQNIYMYVRLPTYF